VRPLQVANRALLVSDLLPMSQRARPKQDILTKYATYPILIMPDSPVSVNTVPRVYHEGTPRYDLSEAGAKLTGGGGRLICMLLTIYSSASLMQAPMWAALCSTATELYHLYIL
jgi:hypothetical protein